MARVRRNRRRRRYAAPIGGAFILLALVGFISVVVTAVTLTDRLLDNQAEKEQIEDTIRPVLMWDPLPFENPADINPVQLLNFSMWATLMDENTTHSFNENMEIIVPASDLDVAAATLFGPGIELHHRTFGDYEQSFYFDAARGIYHVPATVQLFLYSPRVISIERNGEFYDVRVGYIPPMGTYTANLQGLRAEPRPDKYMIYVMRRVGDTFQIVAVREDPATIGETHLPW